MISRIWCDNEGEPTSNGMMKNNKKTKISYEQEADVLRIETSQKPIDYATEMGNIVVHFSADNIPVYFEILEATKFLKKASTLLAPLHRRPALAIH